MPRNKVEIFVIISLLLITTCTYYLQRFAWDKVLVIDSKTKFPILNISDEVISNGKSTSSYTIEDDKIILSCEIIASDYAWPFCELAFQLHDENSVDTKFGINLSNFDMVSIYANYENIAPTGVRFHLRNYNPVYSNLNDDTTLKYNAIEYLLYGDTKRIDIQLKSLQVSTWWIVEQQLPMKYSRPELENVMLLEISTGSTVKPGKYTISLEKIVFQGKYFKTEHVYIAIISLWIFSTLFLFFYHLRQNKLRLLKAQKKSSELTRLNKLLNVQSQKLKEKADRDPLTGALNRAGIKTILIEDIPVISIAFIDIDHFKKINDSLGHAAGDDILCEFSTLLSQNSRDTDFLARWGGEEFLLLCPNTSLTKIHTLVESIRALIENHQWPHGVNLTASFGIAEKEKENITDFIARADNALYAAKAQGRNRVVISNNKAPTNH
jgi:diguanylate cyclase (GGDEF)-like protein